MLKARKLANTDIRSFEDQREYILHRPSIYIGLCSPHVVERYVYVDGKLAKKKVTICNGLLKTIDEVITNSVDVAIKSDFKVSNIIKVDYNEQTGEITVIDNGTGIPVLVDDKTGKYVPELVFTTLQTGSNFDDDEESESAGVNGVGVSLTNIFSKKFKVKTYDGEKSFKQCYSNNAEKIHAPTIRKSKSQSKTEITFLPDYEYFKMSKKAFNDLPTMIEKRVRDLAFAYPEILFRYNNIVIPKNKKPLDDIHKDNVFSESKKVRIGVTYNDEDNFEAFGFVNGCETNIGTHIDYATAKIVNHFKEHLLKKHKIKVRANDIKKQIIILMAIRVIKPVFIGQVKEILDSPAIQIGPLIDVALTEKVLNKILKVNNVLEKIIETYNVKEQVKENLQVNQLQKTSKRIKIPKYVPAINKKINENILFIAEGDSALSSLISVRDDHMAGVPIRGKFINVYEKKEIKILENEEVNMLMQIIGLKIGEKADNINFGKIAILSDQDHDGNAIAGLLINFFYKFWPELFKQGIIIRVLSPLYILRQNTKIKRFYSHDDFENFDPTGWKIQYNKGLGSLGKDEYKYMVKNMNSLKFVIGEKTDSMLQLVYAKDPEPRKEWLKDVRVS